MRTMRNWLSRMWRAERNEAAVIDAYGRIPAEVVLDLYDSVYCQVYTGKDLHECYAHNARRSVVHEMLLNIDRAQRPDKYRQAKTDEVTDVRFSPAT